MKKIYLLLILSLFTLSTTAQTKYDPIRFEVGVTNNKIELKELERPFDLSNLNAFGIRVASELYINPSFNAALSATRGKLRFDNIFRGTVTDLDARLTYKFNNGYILPEDARVSPFISSGFGMTNLDDQEYYFGEFQESHAMIPFAAGLNWRVNPKTDLVTQATFKNSIDDTYNYMQYSLGVKFTFKRNKDSDEDGVFDRDDACPEMAGPISNNGCPLDDDDNDGVANIYDACPNVAGTLNGCPDTDGDTVPDIYDACPNTAGDPALGGCPDSDNDSVVDSQDPCPNTYGIINGCTQQAIESMIPESEEHIKVKLIEAAENILFELDEATLTQASYEALNDILNVLQNNPSMKLDINGHADNTGSVDYNYQLSKNRAETVRKYFIGKGIAANRLMAEGFGERAPRTDNDTSGERALNRRVDIDFIISNK
ncbi:OmpA family protein [Roseivirga echinicomitans]|uniref:OmpA-like domain-containing protein n=1 Tax=Roseivirga echinicomitans TaxID=296218 RepID=A0A150X1X2_9BACT|nr:OmpA family protein [Roseivirga echinicomitans]KYG72727.1 hypothetical protein AWN68_08445 [Roseivirga echinicomitans]